MAFLTSASVAAVSLGFALSSLALAPAGDEQAIPAGLATHSVLEVTNACMMDKGLLPEGSEAADHLGTVTADGDVGATEEKAVVGDPGCLQRALELTMAAITSNTPTSSLDRLVDDATSGEIAESGTSTGFVEPPAATITTAALSWNFGDSARFIPVDTPNRPPNFATGMQWIQTLGVDRSISDFSLKRGTPSYMDWSSDGCSAPLIGSGPYDFISACYRHDFGWRNLKGITSRYGKPGWNAYNKSVADTQFSKDMDTRCFLHANINACYAASDAYAAVVRTAELSTRGMINHVYRW